jgi:hypothetical protein
MLERALWISDVEASRTCPWTFEIGTHEDVLRSVWVNFEPATNVLT